MPEQTKRDAHGAQPRRRAIVGIGASAGGLEAISRCLEQVPADIPLAFVVVQHMDPAHEDLLTGLLQRRSALPVEVAAEGLEVRAGHVYVLPPGFVLSIVAGRLSLRRLDAAQRPHLPVDGFFASLANDQGAASVGIVLSGTGSDGTDGLRAIRAAGGVTLAQRPTTAEFDGMPRSAIEADVVDALAEPAELVTRALDLLDHAHVVTMTGSDTAVFDQILEVLDERSGRDFSQHKPSSVARRIQRRIAAHQLESASEYLELLRANAGEAELLVKELLIGVTSFFRDLPTWERLRDEALPALLARHPDGTQLRAWVPGCSTGEEAFTLAITFREALAASALRRTTLKVFATDIDAEAIARARTGQYSDAALERVPASLRERYFTSRDDGWVVAPEIREMVVFATHDVTEDPPFTRIDVLSCRNLLIYFGPSLQERVLRTFHYALRVDGILVLGGSESTTVTPELYGPLLEGAPVLRRLDVERPTPTAAITRYAARHVGVEPDRELLPEPSLRELVDELVVREHAPAAVLTNADGDIVYITARTGDFLEPAVGAASLNLFSMVRDQLGEALLTTFHTAIGGGQTETARGIAIATAAGTTRTIDVIVRPLSQPEALRGFVLVLFADHVPVGEPAGVAPRAVASDDRVTSLARELHVARERARTLREETQASREELTSANEELQSTNEELSTSREELQSTNEELRTINTELQSKVHELARASDDLSNLIEGTNIAILFLDRAMRVRRYTREAMSVIRLKPPDTGRPFTDLVSDIDYPALPSDVEEVMRAETAIEREVAATGDRWFLVRLSPYRTESGVVDGAVLTFGDITDAKHRELELQRLQAELEGRIADQTAELAQVRGSDQSRAT